jgi:putative oxidoreductase
MIELVRQLGFLLLGGLFVWGGAMHFATFKDVAAMIAERGFPAPAFLLTAGSIVEIVGGLCLILGIGRPYAAAALIVFTIAASLMMLDFWRYSGVERQSLRSGFMTNIAIIGGLLLAATADPE